MLLDEVLLDEVVDEVLLVTLNVNAILEPCGPGHVVVLILHL